MAYGQAWDVEGAIEMRGRIGCIATPAGERAGDHAAGVGVHGDDVRAHDARDGCAG